MVGMQISYLAYDNIVKYGFYKICDAMDCGL